MTIPKELEQQFINSLDDKEQIALEIAKKVLESSFDLIKSIGFIKWLKKNHYNIYQSNYE
tara:strand:- start:1021 stop:1200 length:180 start_codon:yes stop_codon:yes gene_type:complete